MAVRSLQQIVRTPGLDVNLAIGLEPFTGTLEGRRPGRRNARAHGSLPARSNNASGKAVAFDSRFSAAHFRTEFRAQRMP